MGNIRRYCRSQRRCRTEADRYPRSNLLRCLLIGGFVPDRHVARPFVFYKIRGFVFSKRSQFSAFN
jgi:hypothetical protein